MKPRLMPFDGPTSALDPEPAGEVSAVVRTRAYAQLRERVVFMDGGAVLERSTGDLVLHPPQHDRRCAFLSTGP